MLLKKGFKEDIDLTLRKLQEQHSVTIKGLPARRQTVMVSATLPVREQLE